MMSSVGPQVAERQNAGVAKTMTNGKCWASASGSETL
jgi:hypothetical protein